MAEKVAHIGKEIANYNSHANSKRESISQYSAKINTPKANREDGSSKNCASSSDQPSKSNTDSKITSQAIKSNLEIKKASSMLGSYSAQAKQIARPQSSLTTPSSLSFKLTQLVNNNSTAIKSKSFKSDQINSEMESKNSCFIEEANHKQINTSSSQQEKANSRNSNIQEVKPTQKQRSFNGDIKNAGKFKKTK